MKYKIVPGSRVFEKMQELYVRIKYGEERIQWLVEEVGAKTYATNGDYLCGGIAAFDFDGRHPAEVGHWVEKKHHAGWYFPRRNKYNAALLERINALPTISNDELLTILELRGFQFYGEGTSMCVFRRPGVIWGQDVILLTIPDTVKYEPIEGVDEILVSEFNRLEATIKPGWYQPAKTE